MMFKECLIITANGLITITKNNRDRRLFYMLHKGPDIKFALVGV